MTRRPYRPTDNGQFLPLASIIVRRPGRAPADGGDLSNGLVDGLLDTGSPWTYIPEEIAESCQLPEADTKCVQLIDGSKRSFRACRADIMIFDRLIPKIRVLLFEMNEALIGRDVLEHFILAFDGPAKEWRLIK